MQHLQRPSSEKELVNIQHIHSSLRQSSISLNPLTSFVTGFLLISGKAFLRIIFLDVEHEFITLEISILKLIGDNFVNFINV